MTGTITADSGKGFFWCEADTTHQSVFIHINEVKDHRRLHVTDRVKFDIGQSPRRPGQTQGLNVEYIGRAIAAQFADGVRHE